MGIVNCPGCPTLTGSDKLIQRVRSLTDFKINVIHFTYCMKTLCPFKEKYKSALEEEFPEIKIVIGTHEEHVTPEEYRQRVKKLFCQPRKMMVDVILDFIIVTIMDYRHRFEACPFEIELICQISLKTFSGKILVKIKIEIKMVPDLLQVGTVPQQCNFIGKLAGVVVQRIGPGVRYEAADMESIFGD